MKYLLLFDNEDGRFIKSFDDWRGVDRYIQEYFEPDYGPSVAFIKNPPGSWSDDSMPRNTFCLIRGEIVCPTAVEKVTKWEIKDE